MDNFIVSARKYRPATFDTVVGQSSITTTLKNAIKNKHLAQAFLFCGPRGVGKTTCARILAKTINCDHLTPEIEACNVCESCVAFNESASLNIYELDAASNNSVEDMRNLVEQVRILPHQGKFKIYIIDEVHMLSNAAFNAFLKTLEEPPSYAIFILATTEKHKIIPTILSRCQIYDFNRISSEDIAHHLAYVAGKEQVEAEPEALHIIAQKADGALRDALSIFDQVVSFSGNKITYKEVIENLNILDTENYFNITSHLINGDIANALLVYDDIINNGFDGHNFIAGLSGHFRNLLVCKNESTLVLLDASTATREKFKQQAALCNSSLVLHWLELSARCDLNYKIAKNQRLLVELSLMKMCASGNSSSSAEQKKNDFRQPASSIAPGINGTSSPTTKIASPAEPVSIQPVPEKKPDPVIVLKETPPVPEKTIAPKTDIPPPSPQRSRTVSILDSISKADKEAEPAEQVKYTAQDAFTSEAMLEVWKEYAKQITELGKKSLHATLQAREPSLKENHEIEFEVDNLTNISTEKTELLAYLRKKLNNYSISLNIVVKKIQESNPIPYSTSEKFKKMAGKNPLLTELKNQFDLEIDF